MARMIRFDYPEAIHHAYARGNERQNIFRCDNDRRIFLNLLAEAVERFDWRIYSYCLMYNHYHLVLKTLKGSLSEGMHWLNGTYAQKFNYIYDRVGHLFQGRFKNTLVQSGPHLSRLNRYVVLNPVRAKMVIDPAEYEWSSFAATIGRVDAPDFLDVQSVVDNFGSISAYSEYVLAGAQSKPDEIYKPILGSKDFIKRSVEGIDDPSITKLVRPTLSELIPDNNKWNRGAIEKRNVLIKEAVKDFGYKQTEIASYLKMHSKRISKIVNDYR